MSSAADDFTTLKIVQRYLYRIGGPILMIIGTVSCIINLLVFTQKTLRKNPCSIYFVAINMTNLCYIYSSILTVIVAAGYDIDLTSSNLIFCRFFYYVSVLFDILSSSYLVLASIDRVLVTSSNALTRQRSTRRLACVGVISGTLFWMLFHCHTFIFVDIQQFGSDFFLCYFRPGLYTTLTGYYSLLIKGLIVPLLMIIFGIWTWRNILKVRHRTIAPAITNNGSRVEGNGQVLRVKDRQFVLMVATDICIYILCNLMLLVVIIYQQIPRNGIETVGEAQINLFMRLLGAFVSDIGFCIDCYGNLIISKTFRKEVRHVLFCQ